ncbi:cation:dicarboxylate symporter family transporter, partial [Aerococcus christensenii]
MKKIQLTSQILIAMILGLVAGSFFGERIAWIQLIGDLFLRGIQMAVVVMIMGAVIEAVGQLNPKELGKVGGKLAAWFVGGTLVSAAVGLLFAQWIRP